MRRGRHPVTHIQRIPNWVRRETRKGLAVGGLCTAAYTMAKAGILDGRRATIHWENQDSFSEEFTEIELTNLSSS